MTPGEYVLRDEPITCNEGAETRIMNVTNRGDRPVQVGSHYHFAEVNAALEMDRVGARGFRLDIPAGTAVRFEPGDARSVHLVEIGGNRQVHGFQNRVNGSLGVSIPAAHTEAIGGTAGIDAEAEPQLAAEFDIGLPNTGADSTGFSTSFGVDPVYGSLGRDTGVAGTEAGRGAAGPAAEGPEDGGAPAAEGGEDRL